MKEKKRPNPNSGVAQNPERFDGKEGLSRLQDLTRRVLETPRKHRKNGHNVQAPEVKKNP